MRTVLGWVAAMIGGSIALVVLTHLFISPINPQQEAPERHVTVSCWWCHTVSDSIAVVEP